MAWHERSQFFHILVLSSLIGIPGCSLVASNYSLDAVPIAADWENPVLPNLSAAADAATLQILSESWNAYRQRFIQADGRVIDYEAGDRTVSEGQAYAMLRAVLIDDPETFAQTLGWAESNLQRWQGNQRLDQLWVWKWGQLPDQQWGIIDPNFASDADIDAITALILAARRWQRPDYLELAQAKLNDLWNHATVEVGTRRYLLPGPASAFQTDTHIYLNPSYLAPYAFRLFVQVDSEHDWLELVDSSYQILEESAALSELGLPSDWVALNLKTGKFEPIPLTSNLQSRYGFDAYRVWWRIAWDAAWFDAPQAHRYLTTHLQPLQNQWQAEGKIPAQIDLRGRPLVSYEATGQYAMLYAGMQHVDAIAAQQIYQQKLNPQYQQGFWDDNSAYYTQNLVWLGLFPPHQLEQALLD